ncbi:MAG: secretin N-terminal domain-containing protein [Nitrospirota bacterium]
MRSNRSPLAFIFCISFILSLIPFSSPGAEGLKSEPPFQKKAERMIALDFNAVDLPVFVKFISELTGKNFVIDERVKGKVTIYSPTKISIDAAYALFLSVLELKGFSAVPSGDIIQILPTADVPPERSINIYYLENANADEISKILTVLAQKPPASTAPGRPPLKAEFEASIQIISDKPTNSLVITATPRDYEMLKGVIKKLDRKRRQVYVEAVIMEITVDKLKEIGTDFNALLGYANADIGVLGGFNRAPEDFTTLASDLTGAGLPISTSNIRAFIKALRSSSDANVLSTPQILTTDNQKAKIVVGQNVPFPTGSTVATGAQTVRTIERKDVGITLEITPQILEGDRVRLDIRQEISSVVDTTETVLVDLGPSTNKREASTSVIVDNQQPVVIGGLIKDDIKKTESKIPLLGDIPLLGWFFKFQSKRIEKTNLLIFLTPYIVKEPEDLKVLREKKGMEMKEFMDENKIEDRARRQNLIEGMINIPGSESR